MSRLVVRPTSANPRHHCDVTARFFSRRPPARLASRWRFLGACVRRGGARGARERGGRNRAARSARERRARPRARVDRARAGRGPRRGRVSASRCASAWDDADRFRRGKNDDAPVEPELPRPRLNSQGVRAVPRSTAANIARARRGAGRASAGEVARVGGARPLSPRRLRTTGKKGKRASSADLARNSPEESLQEVNTRNKEGSFGSPVSDEKKKKSRRPRHSGATRASPRRRPRRDELSVVPAPRMPAARVLSLVAALAALTRGAAAYERVIESGALVHPSRWRAEVTAPALLPDRATAERASSRSPRAPPEAYASAAPRARPRRARARRPRPRRERARGAGARGGAPRDRRPARRPPGGGGGARSPSATRRAVACARSFSPRAGGWRLESASVVPNDPSGVTPTCTVRGAETDAAEARGDAAAAAAAAAAAGPDETHSSGENQRSSRSPPRAPRGPAPRLDAVRPRSHRPRVPAARRVRLGFGFGRAPRRRFWFWFFPRRSRRRNFSRPKRPLVPNAPAQSSRRAWPWRAARTPPRSPSRGSRGGRRARRRSTPTSRARAASCSPPNSFSTEATKPTPPPSSRRTVSAGRSRPSLRVVPPTKKSHRRLSRSPPTRAAPRSPRATRESVRARRTSSPRSRRPSQVGVPIRPSRAPIATPDAPSISRGACWRAALTRITRITNASRRARTTPRSSPSFARRSSRGAPLRRPRPRRVRGRRRRPLRRPRLRRWTRTTPSSRGSANESAKAKAPPRGRKGWKRLRRRPRARRRRPPRAGSRSRRLRLRLRMLRMLRMLRLRGSSTRLRTIPPRPRVLRRVRCLPRTSSTRRARRSSSAPSPRAS